MKARLNNDGLRPWLYQARAAVKISIITAVTHPSGRRHHAAGSLSLSGRMKSTTLSGNRNQTIGHTR